MRTQHWFKIGSFALGLHARNVAISTKSGEKDFSDKALFWVVTAMHWYNGTQKYKIQNFK